MRTADTRRREQTCLHPSCGASSALPGMPPLPPHPTAQGEVSGVVLPQSPSPPGYQASKMFADRNDKLLINNAFVA